MTDIQAPYVFFFKDEKQLIFNIKITSGECVRWFGPNYFAFYFIFCIIRSLEDK